MPNPPREESSHEPAAPIPVEIAVNPIHKGKSESEGDRMEYASLAAAFVPESHQVYYQLLARAIDTDGVRNVALTGAYGTGKSSVLEQLHKKRGAKAIQLSLSTIAPPERDNEDPAQPTDASKTNLIQKEIVKQLLYLLPPEKTPRSRFRRARTPKNWQDVLIAATAGTLVMGALQLLGLLKPFVERLTPPAEAPSWTIYVLLLGFAAGAVWCVRRLVSGRLSLSASVETGLTTVTLSEKSDTYFDEYLDEIVYFFQASRVEVVVIEDIDRFKDVQVFDTLRALNGLLNGAGSLSRIVFVYAIRDSVFERIGLAPDPVGAVDPAARAVELASRTKFFDVIIPVVPFLSADNARDLMSQVMTSADYVINQGLIRTAARHTADMRLIHNIRNEFEVYRNRLVVPEQRLYGIDDDLVFAMVLYKNTHLGDFEAIRQKASSLDNLYMQWRELVNENLKTEMETLARLRMSVTLDETRNERARRLGELALARGAALLAGFRAGQSSDYALTLSGAATEETIRDPETWVQIAAGSALQYAFVNPRRGMAHTMTFVSDELAALLGTEINADEWAELDRTEVAEQVLACEERIRFLRHHDWEQLCSRPEFKLALVGNPATEASGDLASAASPPTNSGSSRRSSENTTQEPTVEQLTFDQLVGRNLLTPLAKELVRKGFVTAHFALYTSTYYGTHLGPDALEYVRRCIEPGQPDPLYRLSPEAVQQILFEQGADKDDLADIFEDPSIFNVSIVDYLIGERPAAARKVAVRLAVQGETEAEFVDTYCTKGDHPDLLLSMMAPTWPSVVQYTANVAPVSSEMRTKALDAVLNNLPTARDYDVDSQVRQIIETTYRELRAVTNPFSAERADIVLGIAAASGAILESISPLNAKAREVTAQRRLYPVTEENLRELTGSTVISLDTLKDFDERIYTHAVHNLDDYMSAFASSPSTEFTIRNPQQFVAVVNDTVGHGGDVSLGTMIQYASPCLLDDITKVPAAAWTHIMQNHRASPSFANVDAYMHRFGVDHALASFLGANPKLEWDEDHTTISARRVVAAGIINAVLVIPSIDARVKIAAHLEPGELDVDDINPETGELPARLIAGRLLDDDSVTFGSALMTDWTTRELAIVASQKYAAFVAPETLPASHITKLLASRAVAREVKSSAVSNLEAFLDVVSRTEAEEIARFLNSASWRVSPPRIRALIKKEVTSPQIVRFIARERDMSVYELRELLRMMGGEYERLADVGTRPVQFPDDADHRAVAEWLKGVTVSTYGADRKKPGKLRVNLRRTES